MGSDGNHAMLREVPSDVQAEMAVLGALMAFPQALPKIADWLVEGHFYAQRNRLIFRAVATLAGRGVPVDPVTMSDWFSANGLSDHVTLDDLVQLHDAAYSAANIVAYAEIVVEKARLRTAIDIGTKLVEAGYRGNDARQALGDTQHAIAQLQSQSLRGALEPIQTAAARTRETVLARMDAPSDIAGIPWPWRDINRASKGIRDGVLYLIGARPNMGKSVFGLQVATHAALMGHRTAYFSVEMSAEECLQRAYACVGRIPHAWLESPTRSMLDDDLHQMHFDDAFERLSTSPLLIDETPAITITQLMARARRAHMQQPLRLIVVDHIHDMKIDNKREARFELGDIAQGLKTLAKEFKCGVIAMSQLKRKDESRADKRPSLTDLRESGELEQKADVVWLLHREDYYDHESSMKGALEVLRAKQRNMPGGKPFILQTNFSEMRLDNWEGPEPLREKPTPRGMT